MYQMYFPVYLVISIVSTAPVPYHDFLNSSIHVSSANLTIDGNGSCGFIFSLSETNKASSTFNKYMLDKTVSVIYLYLQQKRSDQIYLHKYLSDDTKRNGLQEWIWIKKKMMYEELSLPTDLDSLTFTLTKYGTRNMDIPWSLSTNCYLNNKISYLNETKHIVNYLWTSITKNETGSLICHRSFNDETLVGTKAIWYLTTVWIGYDFECFSIKSLMNGEFTVAEETKNVLTKILTVVLGLFAYMHPFIIHLVEIAQPDKNTDLDKYYKNKDQYKKPYGITRVMQKIFFTPWYNRELRTNKAVKYAPIVRFYFFWTLVVFGLNLYKLLIYKVELFEKEEYTNFPTIYRYGIPEYQFLNHIPELPLAVSILSYFVCNVWIYILYNETDDIIICFGKDICCRSCSYSIHSKYICCVPVKNIMETERNTDPDRWMLNASKKLIFRFTMLFSLQFWRFIFTYSFCSVGRGCKKVKKKYSCVCVFHNTLVGILLLITNIFFNILFCSMPVIWFLVFLPYSIANRYCKNQTTSQSTQAGDNTDTDNGKIIEKEIFQIRKNSGNGNELAIGRKNVQMENNRDNSNDQTTGRENSQTDNNRSSGNKEAGGRESSQTEKARGNEQATGKECSHTHNNRGNENEQDNESSQTENNKVNGNDQATGKESSQTENNRGNNSEQATKKEFSRRKNIRILSKHVSESESTKTESSKPNGNEQTKESGILHTELDRNNSDEQITEYDSSQIENKRDDGIEQTTGRPSSQSETNRDNDNEKSERSNGSETEHNRDDTNQQVAERDKCKVACEIMLYLLYVVTFREHVGFFVFIERSISYTIISSFIVSEHVLRWYFVLISSFGYFTSYFVEFRNFYSYLLNTIFEICEKDLETHRLDENESSNSNSINIIDEELLDYIIDDCYIARKRFFLLVIKTSVTTIFMIVSLKLLQGTGRFDETNNFNAILSTLVILISPKLILFLVENKSADEIEKHVSEIDTLYKNYSSRNNERYEGDVYFLSFKKYCICDCCTFWGNCGSREQSPFISQLLHRSFCDCRPCFSLTDLQNLQQKKSLSGSTKTSRYNLGTINQTTEKAVLL